MTTQSPIHFDRPHSEGEASPSVERRVGWATVLVVDDDREVTVPLARRLAEEGVDVIPAFDGRAALDQALLEAPDLILLDLHLPRVHGFKFLHWLREELGGQEVPIVLITGDPDPAIEQRVAPWGVRRVLRKPLRIDDVLQEIRDALAA